MPTPQTPDLLLVDLHGSLCDPAMNSMNFLNEIAERYPKAISFAAGRPTEAFFDTEDVHLYLDRYTTYLRDDRGMRPDEVRRALLQYGPTKGIIAELVCGHLAKDQCIEVPIQSIVITAGCQEALFLALRALKATSEDIVLAVSPTYVGLAGAARLSEMPVWPVRSGPLGIDLDDLDRQVATARHDGLRPRALYVIPDSANPTGISMDARTRRALLTRASQHGLLVLEDSAYSVYAGPTLAPSLKSLDTGRTVIQLGSFAKTSIAGARVGYVVADQLTSSGPDGATGLLADHLSVLKSMLTVNTSPIAQAVVGGSLLDHGLSLRARNHREIALYDRNRQLMLEGLSRRFGEGNEVSWNSPDGGFFLTLTVPFEATDEVLEHSAREHGLLWTPMAYFYGDGGGLNQIRLSYSQVTPQQIERGLDRLGALLNGCHHGRPFGVAGRL
ncbi:PLP-dependent aminotransferase family protein [Streptomyces sp. NPDC018045]|uniref:PLP-dependent aminotransferase family protein n=1 Tax=Streptomyces sp. NPDC018045 TaxID=3365037 RepID=UPI0037934E49